MNSVHVCKNLTHSGFFVHRLPPFVGLSNLVACFAWTTTNSLHVVEPGARTLRVPCIVITSLCQDPFCGGALLQSVTRARPTALLVVASLPSLSLGSILFSRMTERVASICSATHWETRGIGCRSFHKLWFRTENQGERLLDNCRGGAYYLGRDYWDAQVDMCSKCLHFTLPYGCLIVSNGIRKHSLFTFSFLLFFFRHLF